MKRMPSRPGSKRKRWLLMALSIMLLFVSVRQVHASSPSKPKKQKAAGMSWVRMHKQYPDSFILNGPRNSKRIALTFDDAPDPRFTPQILDTLASYDVCATFFIVGSRAVKHPALVRRIHQEGHTIGNHSYNHAVLSRLSPREFHTQIWRTDAIVSKIIGYHPRFVRPPYGEMLPNQVAWSKKSGYTVVNWDVDSVDWRNNPNSGIILHNIKKTLQPGSIVLQHAGGGYGQDLSGTIQVLPVLISQLRKKGYTFVTLPELLNQPADKMK